MLSQLPNHADPQLLVGFDTADDAAVYQLNEQTAIISTLDFFPPVVDDPYTFGKIAAANALSDVYAMGGRVLLALNMVCFPKDGDMSILAEILRGGAEKVAEAGGITCGGHSISDTEVKYGLSVTGVVDPKAVYANNGARPGDVLVLTKPLGIGLIMGAYNKHLIKNEAYHQAVEQMQTLNKTACEVSQDFSISACTDITGFGFLGHAYEMRTAACSLVINTGQVPYIPAAYDYAREGITSGGAKKNRAYLVDKVDYGTADAHLQTILLDPQTSGGLCFALPANQGQAFVTALQLRGVVASLVGQVVPAETHAIRLV